MITNKIINIVKIKCRLLFRKSYSNLIKLFYKLPTYNFDFNENEMPVKPPILDDICLPPFMGPKDHDDYTSLMKIIMHYKPNNVLELGTAHGNTVANICNHLSDTKVYTVNAPIEKQTGNLVTYNLEQNDIGRVYRNHGFENRVIQIYENTLYMDLSKYIDGKIIDLVIIDACHDTDYVINDFKKVIPFVKKGGIVLFHDTHPSMDNHLIGSYTACMILRKKGYDIKHIENTWWGFWINNS
ncbi:class I SAM-dependent methyltransferase [Bacteroidetes/Chlorobi group bacterium ChocPot_Mid]|nr:MAG: class I SAM-dependent methyltransferase [Bacteroidetes/Chlorobi group bacterium ChocPot_Mid]